MRKKHTVVELAVYGALAFIFLSCNSSWANQIKNGSTAVVSFLARNASNLSQYITGLTTGTTNITVYRENLSALSLTTNTLSEVANGLYRITLNATHTNTTGELIYRINWSSGEYWGRDEVVDNLVSDVYSKVSGLTFTTANKVDARMDYIGANAVNAASAQLGVNLVNVSGAAVSTSTAQLGTNVVNWKDSTAPAMTGDAYARLGAPAGASVSADIAAVKSDSGAILTDTSAVDTTAEMRTFLTGSDTALSTLTSAGVTSAVWDISLPGAYAAGKAGYILGTYVDVAMSSRLAAAAYTAPDADWTAGEKADILAALGVTDGEATQTLDTLYTEIKKARR